MEHIYVLPQEYHSYCIQSKKDNYSRDMSYARGLESKTRGWEPHSLVKSVADLLPASSVHNFHNWELKSERS